MTTIQLTEPTSLSEDLLLTARFRKGGFEGPVFLWKYSGYSECSIDKRLGDSVTEYNTKSRSWRLTPDTFYRFEETKVGSREHRTTHFLTTTNGATLLTVDEFWSQQAARWPQQALASAREAEERWGAAS